MNTKTILLSLVSVLSVTMAHMAMTEPAPRRSPNHSGYRGGSSVDYDMTSPLGGSRKFPCRGAPKGPKAKTYTAGQPIKTHIGGSAKHGGGHCQFSMTYDDNTFVVLKTIYGTCLMDSVNYEIPLPKDAPNGNVTLAWSWFNKVGNREFYMNCADIEITGGSDYGAFTGKKMVVANWPGHPTLPEGFANDYGKDMFESQPILSIKPNGAPKKPSVPEKPKYEQKPAYPNDGKYKSNYPAKHDYQKYDGSQASSILKPFCSDKKTLSISYQGNLYSRSCNSCQSKENSSTHICS